VRLGGETRGMGGEKRRVGVGRNFFLIFSVSFSVRDIASFSNRERYIISNRKRCIVSNSRIRFVNDSRKINFSILRRKDTLSRIRYLLDSRTIHHLERFSRENDIVSISFSNRCAYGV